MPKRLAIFFNSPYLGGAERSFVHQLKLLKTDKQLTVFIPLLGDSLSESKNLREMVTEHLDAEVVSYRYPQALFQQSRSGGAAGTIEAVLGMGQLLLSLRSLQLHQYDVLWANGNKIGLVLFLWSHLARYTGKLIWHFRDYPATRGRFRFIWRLFRLQKSFRFELVSLSHSVAKVLRETSGQEPRVIYNPVGEPIMASSPGNPIQTIGVVAMLAPWKGLHQILYWASIMETPLMRLGIKKIKIYGGNIYKTVGEHQKYFDQLQKLNQKFKAELVEFCGLTPPQKIFTDIDVLIHPSIEPEPFGRVIVEAFKANIPVVSTCLGGAGELVVDQETGLQFFPYDYIGLTKQIEVLCKDLDKRDQLVQMASRHLDVIESQIAFEINLLVDSY